tara:strand:+ start:52 stop:765 length:714 start_codon:yes stop_codon:yes gene_type:complete
MALILVIFLIFNLSGNLIAEDKLSFDISQTEVVVRNDNNLPTFYVFGYKNNNSFAILKIKGPKQKVILQKKKKILNMWTWQKTGEFSYPSLFHFYTNAKENEINFFIKKDMVDNIKLIGNDDDNLKKELIEKKRSLGMYLIQNNSFQSVEENNPIFFKIPVKFPINSAEGKYFLTMEIIKDGKKISSKTKELSLKKPGFNSMVYKFAHGFSFLYGLISVIVAVILGVSAGIIFKRGI